MEVTFIVVLAVFLGVIGLGLAGLAIAVVIWFGHHVQQLDGLRTGTDAEVAATLAAVRLLLRLLAAGVVVFVAVALYWASLHWLEVSVLALMVAIACLWGLGRVRRRLRAGLKARVAAQPYG